ncbi:hypothetical protein T03_2978 [Trichinella britovi]|uniref:Uncharacterized protein n=2 Tax=Trichinella TaxID=6333 RepID=A0A0V1CVH0_TRIBR|nr:hypothetical protein T03_2978 [Trichinella britovi]
MMMMMVGRCFQRCSVGSLCCYAHQPTYYISQSSKAHTSYRGEKFVSFTRWRWKCHLVRKVETLLFARTNVCTLHPRFVHTEVVTKTTDNQQQQQQQHNVIKKIKQHK